MSKYFWLVFIVSSNITYYRSVEKAELIGSIESLFNFKTTKISTKLKGEPSINEIVNRKIVLVKTPEKFYPISEEDFIDEKGNLSSFEKIDMVDISKRKQSPENDKLTKNRNEDDFPEFSDENVLLEALDLVPSNFSF